MVNIYHGPAITFLLVFNFCNFQELKNFEFCKKRYPTVKSVYVRSVKRGQWQFRFCAQNVLNRYTWEMCKNPKRSTLAYVLFRSRQQKTEKGKVSQSQSKGAIKGEEQSGKSL